MINHKFVIGTALALGGLFSAGLAQAQPHVQWSVTIGSPVFGVPAPVVVVPRPVYVRPAPPVYLPAPVYARPAPPVYVPAPVYGHRGYVQPSRRDVDGDGIPNRYDRVYNPRWDRDGDGRPNWSERGGRNGHRDGNRNVRAYPDRNDYAYGGRGR
jgi:hypothetical protein